MADQLPSDEELIAEQRRANAEFAAWSSQAWGADWYQLFKDDADLMAAFRDGERAGALRLETTVLRDGKEPWRLAMLGRARTTGNRPAQLSIAWNVGYREGKKMAKVTPEEWAANRAKVERIRQAVAERLGR